LTQVLGSWQRVLFVRFQEEETEPLEATDSIPAGKTFLILPGISFATLPGHLLDGNARNYVLYTELTGSPESLDSDATFLQFRTSVERVFHFAPHWSTRLRGQLGVTWSDDFDTLPASHRFFAGGDNSVRGFGLNELSPIDPATGQRVGGRYLVMASAELERDIPNPWVGHDLGGAVFADVGNAFDNWSDPIEYSVGVGLRYRLVGVASIGVDVAQALSQNVSPRFHLRITTLL
jgi:translocation and assembly module TamA